MTNLSTTKRGLPRRPLGLPAGVYVLTVLVVVLALFVPRFLNPTNLSNVSRTAAILALASYGQAIVILIGGIDLSVGSVVGLMSVVVVLNLGLGTLAAMAVGAGVGIGAGAVIGLLVARFNMPPFLVTLGMLTGLHGLASVLVGGIPVEAPPGGAFSWPSSGSIGPLPVPLVLAMLGFIVLALCLRYTVLGRTWFLAGSNPRAAAAAGIRVRRSVFLAYVVGAAFVAVAGVILTSRVHSGQPDLYPNLPFDAIAACAIGGLPLSGGDASASRVIVGVLVVALAENGLQLLDLSSATQLVVIGALTVVAVLAQQRPGRVRKARSAGTVDRDVSRSVLEEAR
jgi:ribose/xylose/arabinose/galactoside ABC-type transport system permease subunit